MDTKPKPDLTAAFWDDVPSADPGAGASPASVTAGTVRVRMRRRTFLRTAWGLAGGLGLTVVGALPPARLAPARATVGTEHLNCTIYGDIAAYTGTCYGFPYSSSYCGSDKWFLNYTDASFSSWPIVLCNSKNAWRWPVSGPTTHTYRCADGKQQARGQSAVTRICSAFLS